MAKWKSDFDPQVVTDRLESAKTIDDAGRAKFGGLEIRQCIILLDAMIDFEGSVSTVQRRALLWDAIFEAGAAGTVEPSTFLRAVSRLEREYMRRPNEKYTLLTTVSVAYSASFPRFRLSDTTISQRRTISSRMRAARQTILDSGAKQMFKELPRGFAFLTATVSAKSPSDAAQTSIDKIDILRGALNLFFNRLLIDRWSHGTRSPVNRIRIGPVHTVHQASGELATKTWWYESQYRSPGAVLSDQKKLGNAVEYWMKIRRYLDRSPLRADLEKFLIRYARALDTSNLHDSFLLLWSLLESLTNTTKLNYNRTIRRSLFLFKDVAYQRQLLLQLREFRNQAVHTGQESDDIEALLYELKFVVEVVLQFLIRNRYQFGSLSDAAKFMELPLDRSERQRRIDLLRNANEYRS